MHSIGPHQRRGMFEMVEVCPERLKALEEENKMMRRQNTLRSWAIRNLAVICEHSNREYAEERKDQIMQELGEELEKVRALYEDDEGVLDIEGAD